MHGEEKVHKCLLTAHIGIRFLDITSALHHSYNIASGRQCVGEWFSDIDIVDRIAHGSGGPMVWAGVCYEQQTQVRFIDVHRNTVTRAHCCAIHPPPPRPPQYFCAILVPHAKICVQITNASAGQCSVRMAGLAIAASHGSVEDLVRSLNECSVFR